MTNEETKRSRAVGHVVHEYANLVSSAEMVLTGKDIDGACFKPPINTHVSHAFYLNCRKLADFFQNRGRGTDIKAEDYVTGYKHLLRSSLTWRDRIDKQLAHLSFIRDTSSKEIRRRNQKALYHELRREWRRFRKRLPQLYADEFVKHVRKRQAPHKNGLPSEFRDYDLD